MSRVLIRDVAQVHVIQAADIDTVEAQDDYVRITARSRAWPKHGRLADLESRLDPAAFVRIHRSWIVALRAVARIDTATKDCYCAVLHDGACRSAVPFIHASNHCCVDEGWRQAPPLRQQCAHRWLGEAVVDQVNHAAVAFGADHAACRLHDLLDAGK